MPTQFVWGLDRDSLAIAFDLVRRRVSKKIGGQPELANQIELDQLGLGETLSFPFVCFPQGEGLFFAAPAPLPHGRTGAATRDRRIKSGDDR